MVFMWKTRCLPFKLSLVGHIVCSIAIIVGIILPHWLLVKQDGVHTARGMFFSCTLSPVSCSITEKNTVPGWHRVLQTMMILCACTMVLSVVCCFIPIKAKYYRTGRHVEFLSVSATTVGLVGCFVFAFANDPSTLGWAFHFTFNLFGFNALFTGLMLIFHTLGPRCQPRTVQARLRADGPPVGIQLPAEEGIYHLPYIGDVSVQPELVQTAEGLVLPPFYDSVIQGGGASVLEIIQDGVWTTLPPPSYEDAVRELPTATSASRTTSRPQLQATRFLQPL